MAVNTKLKKITKKQLTKLLKDAGATNKEIAAIVYPEQTPVVASNSISRALKDNNVQTWVADAFNGTGITLKDLIMQYKEELQATKPLYFKGEFIKDIPDYSTRQKARDSILRLMQAFTPAPGDSTPPPPPLTPDTPNVLDATAKKAMIDAIKRGDVETIERIVFKKDV